MTQKSDELFKQFNGFRYQFSTQDIGTLVIKNVYERAYFIALKKLTVNHLASLTSKTESELNDEYNALFDEEFPKELADLVTKYGELK